MRAHRDGMNAGVGAPGAEHLRILGGEAVDRFLDRLLDAGAVRLPLPAHIGAAVKFDGEGEAGHGAPAPSRSSPDRTSVVSGKSVSVRVDLGGRRLITTKKQPK